MFACLRAHSSVHGVADGDDLLVTDLVHPVTFDDVRLRDEGYTDKSLKGWMQRISCQGWNEAYVFFKHEDVRTGPELAARFVELAGACAEARLHFAASTTVNGIGEAHRRVARVVTACDSVARPLHTESSHPWGCKGRVRRGGDPWCALELTTPHARGGSAIFPSSDHESLL